MNEKNDFALVPRALGALEKAGPGGQRILAGMVADTLALARVDSNLEQWCLLGESHHFGIGRKSDCGEAAKWFRMAADKGHSRAQCWLGYCYQRGDGVAQDMAEGARWFQNAAKQGELIADYNLGVCFEGGLGVSKNRDEMVMWYRKAANQGHQEAQFRLGIHYTATHTGRLGANAETLAGLKWLERAAEKGHTKSQLQLGHLHSLPEGQIAEALKWYRTAVESGSDEAQAALGRCFKDGRGVPQDYFEAVKWFQKAAENGGKDGQYYLGFCYAEGKGVTADPIEASKWFRQSAERGCKKAMLEIGRRYEVGEGVPQNSSEAERWLGEATRTRLGEDQCSIYNLEKPTRPRKPASEPAAKPAAQSRCPRPLRIVMLDDEFLVLDALKMMLGFDLPNSFSLTFADAESALQELEWKDPDLFTTDWCHAGRLNGDGLLRILADRQVEYPVFVISAFAGTIEEGLLKQLVDQGLNVTLLSKPFLMDDLRRLLSRHLGLDYPERANSGG
jgi:TPR repeat protein